MGCNTSKENQGSGEAAENNKENENPTENQTEAVENHSNELDDNKPPSAKTITLRPKSTASTKSNGSAVSPGTPDSCQRAQINKNKEDSSTRALKIDKKKDSEINGEGEFGEDEAATKIQAAFRGHKTRQSMKQPAANKSETSASQGHDQEPTREQLEQEFRADDRELCNAATKIQASFRGHMTRKQEAEKKSDHDNEGSSADKTREELDDIDDIDLSDPDLNKAAVKIQASFRGHLVRKDNEGETDAKVVN